MVAELAFGSVLRYLRAHSSDPRCLTTDGYYELLDDAFRSVGYLQASAFISHMYTELARMPHHQSGHSIHITFSINARACMGPAARGPPRQRQQLHGGAASSRKALACGHEAPAQAPAAALP
jgi:hypothetical protein